LLLVAGEKPIFFEAKTGQNRCPHPRQNGEGSQQDRDYQEENAKALRNIVTGSQ